MYLIATDEAGYGPKLGPLVVAGTVWHLPGIQSNSAGVEDSFDRLTTPVTIDGQSFKIDDSKRVYKAGSGLLGLQQTVGAALQHVGVRSNDLFEVLNHLCPDDLNSILATPWLATPELYAKGREALDLQGQNTKRDLNLSANASGVGNNTASTSLFRIEEDQAEAREVNLATHWFSESLNLVSVGARVVTARDFNLLCRQGYNKSDLLSMTTLGLVRKLLETCRVSEPTSVYCDRHGGRRYYAGVLQDQLAEEFVRVMSETRSQSVYEISHAKRPVRVHFTVKGDRFAPVAYSSLIAKYLRERLMRQLNHFFIERACDRLEPTAGYPVDAERFLREVGRIRQDEKISDEDLIRER